MGKFQETQKEITNRIIKETNVAIMFVIVWLIILFLVLFAFVGIITIKILFISIGILSFIFASYLSITKK